MPENLGWTGDNFSWVEGWGGALPGDNSAGQGRTHGVVCLKGGDVLVFRQAVPSVVRFDPSGEVVESWGDYPGAHGMTLVEEDGVELLWLTDEFFGRVEQVTLEGEVVRCLTRPPHSAYEESRFVPTWVAVDERRFGGGGDIWVADGYGAKLVHRFDESGDYRQTLDGSEGAGRFSCPHGLDFDVRPGRDRALYVADRGNKRFQVFSPDGQFLRVVGSEFLTSPDTFFCAGGVAVVPELFGRVSVLDSDDALLAVLGENNDLERGAAGWANRLPIVPGRFNSPHACAVDGAGNVYVVEWRIGGRIIKLERNPVAR